VADNNDQSSVLAQWGDADVGPGSLNGADGVAVSDAVLRVVRGLRGVSRVCDLGCGNGFTAAQLGKLGYEVVGVDASQRLLDVAQAHYASDRVRFHRAQFEPDLAARVAGPFDLVISIDVIEHLYRPRTFVETAVPLLRPGGMLVVCTPYYGYLKNLAIAVTGRWDLHHGVHFDGGHIKFFSVPTLTRLLSRDFTVESFHYHGRLPWLWKNMIAVARLKG
jgi:2-polyprenyl-3-methyl-5-hydroxy-6-metoxy-1,4-benzoquinol methylase